LVSSPRASIKAREQGVAILVAVYVGGAIVAVGALAAFFIPKRRKQQAEVEALVPELEAAA
jgi:uncharacterized protein (DUF3084 family)